LLNTFPLDTFFCVQRTHLNDTIGTRTNRGREQIEGTIQAEEIYGYLIICGIEKTHFGSMLSTPRAMVSDGVALATGRIRVPEKWTFTMLENHSRKDRDGKILGK